MRHLLLGKIGERHAARFLSKAGFAIVARNYRTPLGEIDIVARDGETLAFIEVKTRSSRAFGLPQEAVDCRKQRQLIRAAQVFLKAHGEPAVPCRFDVVAVTTGLGARAADVTLIRGAFDATEPG
jgi:putative endonuclease